MKKRPVYIDPYGKTKYYRATYMSDSGEQVDEVFVGESMEDAREYAAGPNAHGRQLIGLAEHPDQYGAMTDDSEPTI